MVQMDDIHRRMFLHSVPGRFHGIQIFGFEPDVEPIGIGEFTVEFTVVVAVYLVGIALSTLLASWADRLSEAHKNAVVQSEEAVNTLMTELSAVLPTGYALTIQKDETTRPSTTIVALYRSSAVVESLPPVDNSAEILGSDLVLPLHSFTQNKPNGSFDIWTHGALMVTLRAGLEPYTKADYKRQMTFLVLNFTCMCFAMKLLEGNNLLGFLPLVRLFAVAVLLELTSGVEVPLQHAICQQCLAEVSPAIYERLGYHVIYHALPLHCLGATFMQGVLHFSTTTTTASPTNV